MPTTLTFALAFLFIVFGRWLYFHPQYLAPEWMAGARSRTRLDFARFMGIAMVFVGSSSAAFCVTAAIPIWGLAQDLLSLAFATTLTYMLFRAEVTRSRQMKRHGNRADFPKNMEKDDTNGKLPNLESK